MTDTVFDLRGKVALVTGASKGIGQSIATILARHGAHVIVSSRKLEACEAVAAKIEQSIDAEAVGSAEAKACHVGNLEQIDSLFHWLKSTYGRLDILVNNAAANPYFGHILDTDLAAFQKTVDVNLRGYFFMSVKAAKLMRDTGGSIVNVASVNGVIPGDGQGIYSITKAAVISMTKAFAKECAPLNIRVNAILPGITDTKFAAALVKDDKLRSAALSHVPMKRVAEPDEMAAAVLYFVSDSASYTTGSCLNVDGGYLLG